MTLPLIHRKRGAIAASKMVDAVAQTLTSIREQDGLTWVDMGVAMGKSQDQAAKYATGLASMDFITFLRCCDTWNGRFANPVLGMIGQHVSESAVCANMSDIRGGIIALMELILGLEHAMSDGELDDNEVDSMAMLIESAATMIDGLRDRLSSIRADDLSLKAVG